MPDQSTTTTAECLVCEMFCRFGAPEELCSNQERNFKAGVFSKVCQRLVIQKTLTGGTIQSHSGHLDQPPAAWLTPASAPGSMSVLEFRETTYIKKENMVPKWPNM